MSLEGTLETISLPDVLSLLSVTAKTGELRVESAGKVGSVWLQDGRLAGFDVDPQKSLPDAVFALLRLRQGTFGFHPGTTARNPVASAEVAPVVEEAEHRLAQWPPIASVVPSLSCRVSLDVSVDGPVTLTADQWRLVAAIGSGRSVGDVLAERGLGEFDGCKAVKELADLGLARISQEARDAEPGYPDAGASASPAKPAFAGAVASGSGAASLLETVRATAPSSAPLGAPHGSNANGSVADVVASTPGPNGSVSDLVPASDFVPAPANDAHAALVGAPAGGGSETNGVTDGFGAESIAGSGNGSDSFGHVMEGGGRANGSLGLFGLPLVKAAPWHEDDELAPEEATSGAGPAEPANGHEPAAAEGEPETGASPEDQEGKSNAPAVSRGLLLKFLGSARS